MDALGVVGVVANVTAVVDLSAKLAALCGEYINKAWNATKDIERLKNESEALAKNITQVRDLLGNKNDKDEGHKRQLKASAEFHNDVMECEEKLHLLVTTLDPGSNPSRMKMLGKSLRWPFSGKEVMDNVESLRRWREAFATAMQVDQLRIAVRMDDDLDMRNLPEAEGAHFDAYDQEKEPFCHEETRKDLLRQINDWVDDPNGKCLFWLRGLAGTGKSTISRTVARNFAERNQLAASFFFNRTVEGRNNARLFATTIARDFTRRVPQLRDRILAVVKEDPELAGTILRTQFKKLVLEPLQHLSMNGPLTPTIVIVIDALDECDSETTDLKFDRSRMVVSLLADLATVTGVKVRVFLTSRPELPIRLGFRDDVPQDSHQDVALHDIPDAVIASDIRFFINSQLDVTRSLYRIPPSWPGANKIGKLVEISVPLFIYAATICRFLMDKRKPFPPQKRLDSLLSHTKRAKTGIEKTYKPILEQLLLGVDEFEQEDLLQQFRKVVGTIILLADPLPMASLCKLLQSDPEEVEYFLGSFHSVLNIPDDVQSTQSIKLFHLSFREYLLDNSTGDNQFWVEQDRKHNELFELCVQVMTAGEGRDFYLKKDICSLDDPGVRWEDVDEEVVRRSIPRHLEYACLYWFHHLRNSQKPTDNETIVHDFFKNHYVHWLEAMSWLGRVEQAVEEMIALDDMFRPLGSTTSDFIVDARQFLTQHKHAITVAPCQTYVSALLFSPLSSAVRQQFWCEVPEWVAKAPDVPDSWDTSTRNIHLFTDWIKAMAYSQDGKLLAAATGHHIGVWNSSSGTLVAMYDRPESQRSGKKPISCLAFNPEGILAAGVGNEDSILSWDLQNNSINIHRVKEAGPGIRFLSIAANGRILCASHNGIVCLLDENFGILHDWQMCQEDVIIRRSQNGGPLKRVIDDGVAFSADGAFVAVIENDHAIHVYDGSSFCCIKTMPAPGGFLFGGLTYAPDNKLLSTYGKHKRQYIGGLDHFEGAFIWEMCPLVEVHTHFGQGDRGIGCRQPRLNQQGIFVALTDDRVMSIWANGPEARQSIDLAPEILDFCFSPDGKSLAVASLGQLQVIDVMQLTEANRQHREESSHATKVIRDGDWSRAVASADGSQLAISDVRNVAVFTGFDTRIPSSGALQNKPPLILQHDSMVLVLAWSTDNALLAVALPTEIVLYRSNTQWLSALPVARCSYDDERVDNAQASDTSLAVSTCGSRLVMTGGSMHPSEGRVMSWELPSLKVRWTRLVYTPTKSPDERCMFHDVILSPDNRHIVLSSEGEGSQAHVVLLEAETGNTVWHTSLEKTFVIEGIAMDSAGTRLAVQTSRQLTRDVHPDGYTDRRTKILDPASGQLLYDLEQAVDYIGRWKLSSCSFCSHNRVVVHFSGWSACSESSPTGDITRRDTEYSPCNLLMASLVEGSWIMKHGQRMILLPRRSSQLRPIKNWHVFPDRFFTFDEVRDSPQCIQITCKDCTLNKKLGK